MMPSRQPIPIRLPNEWQQTVPMAPPVGDPMQLLAKLADAPNGLELIQSFHELYRDLRAGQQPTVELVKGRSGSRVALIDALAQAKKQLIIASPWLSNRSVDTELFLRMTALLDRGCHLYIGWGYTRDIKGIHPEGNIIHISDAGRCSINVAADTAKNYSAFPALARLIAKYPGQFQMKLMGTHEKYIICDDQFALIGSHNTLSSLDTLFAPREIGWKTTDKKLIDAHTEYFFDAPDLRNKPELQAKLISLDEEYIDPHQIGHPRLVATAERVVIQRGIINTPNFKRMKNSDIQTFIESYALAVGIPNMSC